MTDQSTDPIARFEQAVLDAMSTHKLTREKAISAVRRTQPKLSQSYLLASQTTAVGRRLVSEMFDSLPG